MRKLLILAMVLMLALPASGLATETPAPEVENAAVTSARPRRFLWQTQPAATPETTPETEPIPDPRDTDQDGLCDHCGQPMGQNPQAPGFVDENKDGVCDNLGTENQGQRQGMGRRGMKIRDFVRRMKGKNQAQGQQRNFTDADGDGQCDHCANCPMQNQRPNQRMFGPGQQRQMQPGQRIRQFYKNRK